MDRMVIADLIDLLNTIEKQLYDKRYITEQEFNIVKNKILTAIKAEMQKE